jgi:hypothetical protein
MVDAPTPFDCYRLKYVRRHRCIALAQLFISCLSRTQKLLYHDHSPLQVLDRICSTCDRRWWAIYARYMATITAVCTCFVGESFDAILARRLAITFELLVPASQARNNWSRSSWGMGLSHRDDNAHGSERSSYKGRTSYVVLPELQAHVGGTVGGSRSGFNTSVTLVRLVTPEIVASTNKLNTRSIKKLDMVHTLHAPQQNTTLPPT